MKIKIAILFGLKTNDELKDSFNSSDLKKMFEVFKGRKVNVHYTKDLFINRIRGYIEDQKIFG